MHKIVLIILLAVAASIPPAHADWNIKRFVVVPGPVVSYSELLPAGTDIIAFENENREAEDMFPDATIADVQRAVNEAADWYRAQGFPEPSLNTVVNTPDGPAYQVYLCKKWEPSLAESAAGLLRPQYFHTCDPEGSNSGEYAPLCNNEKSRNRYFFLVAGKVLDNGKLNYAGYQTVAHEMFHAIAANSQAMKSDPKCKIGRWISEGVADGISFDLLYDLTKEEPTSNGAYDAKEVWAGRFTTPTDNNAVQKSWGIRPYNIPLPHPNGDEYRTVQTPVSGADTMPWYQSSSFWRYVAHHSGEGWRVLVTSKTGKGLFDIKLPAHFSGWQRDVYWLHEGLRGKFGEGLNTIYAGFVNDYAHRLPLPPIYLQSRNRRLSEQDLDLWANINFDRCKEVTLTNDRPSDVIALELEALGSACLWVHPTNWPGTTQISFQVYSEDAELIDDIIIGRPGAGMLTRANQAGDLPGGEPNIGLWPDFLQDGSKASLYIVSNVGKKHPTRSMKRRVELWVSLPNNVVDQRNVPQSLAARPMDDPHPPVQKRQIPSRAQFKKKTADTVAAQMERDKRVLSPNLRSATSFSRRTMVHDCRQPFVYDACGPQLSIGLTLMPGTYIAPGATNAQGGVAAQVFGGLQAMAQTSMGDQTGTVTYLDEQMKRIDASSVSIAIPMIEYGFSGSFDNASINVTMAGERHLSTFGPPDAAGRTRLTGKVTIEEYSPAQLRGRFTAPLAEFLPATSDNSPPRYVRRETITGRFQIVAPWLEDNRVERLQLDTNEDLAYDIANTLGIPPDQVRKLKEQGVLDGRGGAAAGATGAGSANTLGGGGECSCECSMRAHADELCELFCEEEFAACD